MGVADSAPRQVVRAVSSILGELRPARSRRSATLWLIIIVNVLLMALYFWSRGGASTTVRVEAVGSQYRAYVDGRQVAQGSFQGASEGGIGLLLSRHYKLPALPKPYGVDWVRVTDAHTGDTIFEDDFEGEADPLWENDRNDWRTEGGLFTTDRVNTITTGVQPWGDYVLEAKFRNTTEATVYVRTQDANNAVVLGIGQFRGFGGASLARLEDGRAVERVDLGRLELNREETLQSITAMLLRPYPVALLLIAGVFVLTFVVRMPALERLLAVPARVVPDIATGVAIGLAAGTFVLLWYLLYVLGEAMPHVPDAVMYVFQSKIFASFRAAADAPPNYPTESFHIFRPHMLQVVDGRWFTHIPFGHPLFLTAGQLVGAVWLIPPLLGAGSVAMIYWLGKRMFGAATGLLAAVLLFSSPFFLMTGSNLMSHNTAAFTLIGSLFLITQPTRWRLPAMFVAGALLGLLFNIRPLSAVAFLPVLGALLAYDLLRASAADRRLNVIAVFAIAVLLILAIFLGTETLRWFVALAAIAALAVAGAVLAYPLVRDRTHAGELFREEIAFAAGAMLLLGAYYLYNKATTGSFGTNAYEIQGTFTENFIGFGGGHSVTLGIQNQQELLSLMLLVANGWPLAVGLIIAALPFLLGTRNRWDYFLGASFLAIAAAPIFYASTAIMYGPRFWYESLPFLILLTARGAQYLASSASAAADWLAGRLRKGPPMSSHRLAGLATYSVIAGLVVFSISGWLFGQRESWGGIGVSTFTPANAADLEGFNFADRRLLDEADDLGLENALVFVDTCAQWWCYGTVFWANSPDLDGDVVWAERQSNQDDLDVLETFRGRSLYAADYGRGTIVETTAEEVIELVEAKAAEEPPEPPVTVTTTPEERDAIRANDLQSIRLVLEQYAADTGAFPDTAGQVQSLCAYRTLDAACVIESIAPIPVDPLGAPISNGYWYRSDGESYVLIALREDDVGAGTCPAGLFGENDERDRMCVEGALP